MPSKPVCFDNPIDEAFSGPMLQPSDVRRRARMNQVMSILDNYAYRTLVWDIYVERVSAPVAGLNPDADKIAAALLPARRCLAAISDLMDEARWIAGPMLTLADLHAAPMFACFSLAPEAERLLADFDVLQRWWEEMVQRQSMLETQMRSAER